MDFCPIVPTAYLDRFADSFHRHLVLANFYERDPQYAEWYRRRRELGDHIILDNGVYEGQLLDPHDLLKVIFDLKPHVVVLPDVPGQFRRNWQVSQDFAAMLRAVKWNGQTMQVVHAEDGDLTAFTEAYWIAATSNEWIALSRLTKQYGLPNEQKALRRVQFIDHLKQVGAWRQINRTHCLGLLDGHTLELPGLAAHGVVSFDSSAPVWRGLNGYRLADFGWPDIPFTTQGSPTLTDGSLADYNLSYLKSHMRATHATQP